jgi:ribosome-associated protein
MNQYFSIEALSQFIRYKTSRSGGSGGQNVNKVATKVELLFDLENCNLFSNEEKTLLQDRLSSRFQSDGLLQSFHKNPEVNWRTKKLLYRN